MNEEIEDHRYFLEPDGAKITSLCILRHKPSDDRDLSNGEFSVVIGIIEKARDALAKADVLEELLEPADAHRHGAVLKNGDAVVTLSYICASPFGTNLNNAISPAFILGILTSGGYISMPDYEKAMAHYMEMESIPAGLPVEKTSLHAMAGFH